MESSRKKLSLFLAIILVVGLFFLLGKIDWKRFAQNNFHFASSFSAFSGGDWTSSVVWGQTHNVSRYSGFTFPQDFAIAPNGDIYVANSDADQVKVLNPDGTASTTYSASEQVYGIALDANGYIYLAEANIGTVQVLNPDGTASTTYTSLGSDQAIRISKTGEIYVVNAGGSIIILNPDGTASTTYSGVGLVYPRGIAISSTTGYIYVANRDGNTISVLNPDGTASTTYSDGFNQPMGVSLAPSGEIYVADRGNNRIVVLNPDGTASTTYANLGLSGPHNVLLSGNKLYIADTLNSYITVVDWAHISVEGLDYPGINDSVDISAAAVTLSHDQSVQTLGIESSGSLDFAGHTLTVGGHWWQVINNGGTFDFNGGSLSFPSTSTDITSDGVINSGIVTLTQDSYIDNLTLASGGTLDLAGHTLYVAGNWTNGGGTLNTNGGTIVFIGGTQYITGTNTFENVTKIATSSPSGLIFSPLSSTTFSGNLILQGTANTPMTIGLDSSVEYVFNSAFGSNGEGTGQFSGLYGIGIDSLNNIYTVEQDGRVQKFDANGNYLFSIGTSSYQGPYPSAFCGARHVAIDANDNTYVSDYCQRVQKFDSSGNFVSEFGVSFPGGGSGDGEFSGPQGMAFDASGNIYVVDSGNNRVEKFDVNGTYVSQFGSSGSGNSEFNSPVGIAINKTSGNIYVNDSSNNRIEVFDANGNYLSQFGSQGSGPGQFQYAVAITLDQSGNVYVPDAASSRVEKFDSSGNFITEFGSAGSGPGQLAFPSGIAVDSSGNLFVSDQDNERVLKFIPASSPTFQFLASTSPTLSYLSVSNAVNLSSFAFDCTNGCVDGGNNTNWLFPAVVVTAHHGHAVVPTLTATIPATSTATSTATTTQSIATTTATSTVIATSTQNLSLMPPGFCFTVDLYPYSNSSDIQNLQKFLNNQGYLVTNFGDESYYYGPQTKQGVIFFQEKYATAILNPYGLATGTGNFGYKTRVQANNILGCPTLPEPIATTTATTTLPIATSTPIIQTPTTTLPIVPEINTVQPQNTNTTQTNSNQPSNTQNVSTPSQQISNLVLGLREGIQQSYAQVSVILGDAIQKITNIFDTQAGSVISKIVSTAGIVLGATAAISGIAFATPITFSEVWMIPTRMFGLLLGALGIRRKNRPWGTVYDAVTKRPIDPAYVSLVDVATGKEVASAVTDFDGRYGFLVAPGTYQITAQKTNYVLSEHMKGKTFDEVYNDLYFGEPITISQVGQIIAKNIPMDPQKFDWNEFTKEKMQVNTFVKSKDIAWAKISKRFFILGFIVAVIALIAAPQPYNFIIAVVYVFAYALNFLVLHNKKSGTLKDHLTNAPLSFAIVKIFREGDTEPMMKKIADKFGEYYALVPKGRYYLKVEKKNDDQSYTEVLQTPVIDIVKGIVNQNMSL